MNNDDQEDASFKMDLFDALTRSSQDGRCTVLRLLFSYEAGTLVRSDFLSYRLQGCEAVYAARCFLKPLAQVVQVTTEKALSGVNTNQGFAQLLKSAVGFIIARSTTPGERPESLCSQLDDELEKRLSFPWVVQQPLTRRRVFWVQGRANIDASRQFYQAAHALGIDLVVLDAPGHWIEDDAGPYAHFREKFIPFNIDPDEGFTQRIVDAVRAYPDSVDGIVCISDVRLPFVARACEILGLPTSPSTAYTVAGNKWLTRELESAANGGEGFVVETADELDAVLSRQKGQLQFPLIVKPCTGWNSDCVVKVRNEEELVAAVRRASARHAGSPARNTGVVVEPYIDGPEVDANFVVLDGQVLFCDITDDFPCPGDLHDSNKTTFAANFMETLMDVPSALPQDEQSMMRESLRKSIKRCGFQSGVFHCEARVRGSRAYYKPRQDNGILDLHGPDENGRETHKEQQQPSSYLHEVNARPPGYINCVAALLAHGVDYYAIRLLLSLGQDEEERIRALAQPFLSGKPQYTLGIVVLPPTRAGIMASEDAVLEFLEANPELREHVVHYQPCKERGEVVHGPDSSELWCVGYVVVASRKGRKECLELAHLMRDRFDYKLVGEE
jgi:hypothetical protein